MTVKELMTLLETHDPHALVIMNAYELDFTEVTFVTVKRVRKISLREPNKEYQGEWRCDDHPSVATKDYQTAVFLGGRTRE